MVAWWTRRRILQGLGDAPARTVRLHLRKVADVADVIAVAILVYVFPLHRFPSNRRDAVKRLSKACVVSAFFVCKSGHSQNLN